MTTSLRPLEVRQSPDRLRARIAGLVGREVINPREMTYAFMASQVTGMALEPIADPVLKTVAEYPDHREYADAMFIDPDVSEAWDGLAQHWLSQPVEIVEGKSGSPAAKLAAAFAEFCWARIPATARFNAIRACGDAARYGFAPIQAPLAAARWRGRSYWTSETMIDVKPYHVYFGLGPPGEPPLKRSERPLVWSPNDPRTVTVFQGEALRYGWLLPRYGTENSSYGIGLYCPAWIVYQLLYIARRNGGRALEREFGALSVKSPKADLSEFIAEYSETIRQLLDYWNAQNVLLKVGGLEVELLDAIQFVDSWIKLLDFGRMRLKGLFSGAAMASEMPEGAAGSRAMAEVLERGVVGRAQQIAGATVEASLTTWLARMVEFNLDPEPDPDDLPTAISRLRLTVDNERLRTYFELGATLDLGRVAELHGTQGVIVTDPALGGRQYVTKPESPAQASFPVWPEPKELPAAPPQADQHLPPPAPVTAGPDVGEVRHAYRAAGEGKGLWVGLVLPQQAVPAWQQAKAEAEAIVGPVAAEDVPHLTLLYLGKRDPVAMQQASAEATEIVGELAATASPTTLRTVGARVFANDDKGRTPIVLAVDGDSAWLSRLATDLLRRLAHLVTSPQYSDFLPHLTLGYAQGASEDRLAALLSAPLPAVEWTAGALEVRWGVGQRKIYPLLSGSGRAATNGSLVMRLGDVEIEGLAAPVRARLDRHDGLTLLESRAADDRARRLGRAMEAASADALGLAEPHLAALVNAYAADFRELAPDPLALLHPPAS